MNDPEKQLEPHSVEWWESLTVGQLEDQWRGSMIGSRAHEGARMELDRRSAARRVKTDRRIAVASLVAAAIAAVASIITLFEPGTSIAM